MADCAEDEARTIANKIATEAFNSPSLAYPIIEAALRAAEIRGRNAESKRIVQCLRAANRRTLHRAADAIERDVKVNIDCRL